jgi:hypothetical protein
MFLLHFEVLRAWHLHGLLHILLFSWVLTIKIHGSFKDLLLFLGAADSYHDGIQHILEQMLLILNESTTDLLILLNLLWLLVSDFFIFLFGRALDTK